jgi:putative transposase
VRKHAEEEDVKQMKLKAAEINLTQRQKEILERLSNSTHSELHFKIRATIILKAADGIGNRVIAKQMGINRGVATKWRTRYANASKLLEQTEVDSPKKLTETVKEVLSDEYRSGKPTKFTPEQVACIIDLSLQMPESVGVPMTHWTVNALCDKAVELKIVTSISSSQMERFLKRWRSKTTPV